MAAPQAQDRQRLTADTWGRRTKETPRVRQQGSAARRSWDVNAAKHRGRQTDAHTSPGTELVSGCHIGPWRLREVRVAEQEQPDSLSMLLTTRWMNQYVREQ